MLNSVINSKIDCLNVDELVERLAEIEIIDTMPADLLDGVSAWDGIDDRDCYITTKVVPDRLLISSDLQDKLYFYKIQVEYNGQKQLAREGSTSEELKGSMKALNNLGLALKNKLPDDLLCITSDLFLMDITLQMRIIYLGETTLSIVDSFNMRRFHKAVLCQEDITHIDCPELNDSYLKMHFDFNEVYSELKLNQSNYNFMDDVEWSKSSNGCWFIIFPIGGISFNNSNNACVDSTYLRKCADEAQVMVHNLRMVSLAKSEIECLCNSEDSCGKIPQSEWEDLLILANNISLCFVASDNEQNRKTLHSVLKRKVLVTAAGEEGDAILIDTDNVDCITPATSQSISEQNPLSDSCNVNIRTDDILASGDNITVSNIANVMIATCSACVDCTAVVGASDNRTSSVLQSDSTNVTVAAIETVDSTLNANFENVSALDIVARNTNNIDIITITDNNVAKTDNIDMINITDNSVAITTNNNTSNTAAALQNDCSATSVGATEGIIINTTTTASDCSATSVGATEGIIINTTTTASDCSATSVGATEGIIISTTTTNDCSATSVSATEGIIINTTTTASDCSATSVSAMEVIIINTTTTTSTAPMQEVSNLLVNQILSVCSDLPPPDNDGDDDTDAAEVMAQTRSVTLTYGDYLRMKRPYLDEHIARESSNINHRLMAVNQITSKVAHTVLLSSVNKNVMATKDWKQRNSAFSSKSERQHFMPEQCRPIGNRSVWFYMGRLTPSIMHRLQSLLLAMEARDNISDRIRVAWLEHHRRQERQQEEGGGGGKQQPIRPSFSSSSSSSLSSFVNIPKTLFNLPVPTPSLNRMLEALSPKMALENMDSERLETLGDVFLKYAISVELFKQYPNMNEGQLTSTRANYISNKRLCTAAFATKMTFYLRALPLSDGHQQLNFCPPGMSCNAEDLELMSIWCTDILKDPLERKYDLDKIHVFSVEQCQKHMVMFKKLADMVEAVIGAYFVDGGEAAAIAAIKAFGVWPVEKVVSASTSTKSNGSGQFLSYRRAHSSDAIDAAPLYNRFSSTPDILTTNTNAISSDNNSAATIAAMAAVVAPPAAAVAVADNQKSWTVTSGTSLTAALLKSHNSISSCKNINHTNIKPSFSEVAATLYGAAAVTTAAAAATTKANIITIPTNSKPTASVTLNGVANYLCHQTSSGSVAVVVASSDNKADNDSSQIGYTNDSSSLSCITTNYYVAAAGEENESIITRKFLQSCRRHNGVSKRAISVAAEEVKEENPAVVLALAEEGVKLQSLQKSLGYEFKNINLLIEALTHSSCSRGVVAGNNERLEFLGDAVLDLIVIAYWFHRDVSLDPARLHDIKSDNTCNRNLAFLAYRLGVHEHIKHQSDSLQRQINNYCISIDTSRNILAKKYSTRTKPHILTAAMTKLLKAQTIESKVLADTLEAIIGAIYLDSGGDLRYIHTFGMMHQLLEPGCSQTAII